LATYEVLLRRRAEKQLDRVPYADHPRIVRAVRALGDDPRPAGCRKLLDDIYRIRVGPYRVIYKIDDARQEVVVGKVARRREDTYQVIEDLF
jgi:mRNA interferase RelE/StbE